MRPEALDAFTTQTMRPQALEAAAAANPVQQRQPIEGDSPDQQQSQGQKDAPDIPAALGTPFGERTDGTQSAAKVVDDVVQSVKTAVDGALTWAEKKVDQMSSGKDHEISGPYTSPATCVPSDLDVIASGILPAMPAARQYDGNDENADKKEEKAHESEKGKEDVETERDGAAEPKS